MIGKVVRGQRVGGLVRYLFGPGKANEHVDPRVVGGWVEPAALEPAMAVHGGRDFRPLIAKLDRPLAMLDGPSKCVWHCSLRTAPGDRTLSDDEWGQVAADVMHRTGLAPHGDEGGCRWVAVRHADDHVHLVATLARQDGRRAQPRNDFHRVGEACLAAEQRYGLAITAGRDRTAAHRSTRAETEKCHRTGLVEQPRDVLRLEVRSAAAGAANEDEFFARLGDAGVMVGKRMSDRNPGEVTGYKVALPEGLRTAGAEPVWYGGGKLAPDLSLPKLRAHWQAEPAPLAPGAQQQGEALSPRLRLRHQVEDAAGKAASPDEFFARLRSAGVLVRKRFSEVNPAEVTGFSVALPGERDGRGEPIWRGGGSLDPELSFPRIQARCRAAAAGEGPPVRPTPLSGEERSQVWREAKDAADRAAEEIRRLQHSDPAAAGATARSAADLLQGAASAGEPIGRGPMHDAARVYDRASREPYRRQGPRTRAGGDLRMAAVTVALIAAAGRDDTAAFIALVVSLSGLLDAVAELRATQQRATQAAAARAGAGQLRDAATARTPQPTARTQRPSAYPAPLVLNYRRPAGPAYRPPEPPRPTRGR